MLCWGPLAVATRHPFCRRAPNRMAAAPTLIRVRVHGGDYHTVELAPGMSELVVKEVVAGALRLAVGTFVLESDADRRSAGFHAGLTGDWTAVPLLAPPATRGAFVEPPNSSLCIKSVLITMMIRSWLAHLCLCSRSGSVRG